MNTLVIEFHDSTGGAEVPHLDRVPLSSKGIGESVRLPGDISLKLVEVAYRQGMTGTASEVVTFAISFGVGFASSLAAAWLYEWLKIRAKPIESLHKRQIEDLLCFMRDGHSNGGFIVIKKKSVTVKQSAGEARTRA